MEKEKKDYRNTIIAILILAVVIIVFFTANSTDEKELENRILVEKINKFNVKLDSFKTVIVENKTELDSLKKLNNLDEEQEQDEQQKIIEYETIRTINLYSVAEQQSYFDELTGTKESSNTR